MRRMPTLFPMRAAAWITPVRPVTRSTGIRTRGKTREKLKRVRKRSERPMKARLVSNIAWILIVAYGTVGPAQSQSIEVRATGEYRQGSGENADIARALAFA